ncbi:hypothetical protein DFH06DRAFT_1197055 [Mycena polygramma]|nr:hypothetical protein DFH06DRAFT_1197055 [Mycena polygramma]
MGRASARELSKDWYRFEGPTPAKWACDWENWHGITEFFVQPTWFNLSPIDITLRVQFNVNGTVEPLAFCQGPEDDIFHYQDYNLLFATGSEYYDLDRSVYRAEGSVLYRYEERFASHADFLARVDGASRVRIPPMPEYEDRIDTIEHEQMTLRTTDWLLKIERQN